MLPVSFSSTCRVTQKHNVTLQDNLSPNIFSKLGPDSKAREPTQPLYLPSECGKQYRRDGEEGEVISSSLLPKDGSLDKWGAGPVHRRRGKELLLFAFLPRWAGRHHKAAQATWTGAENSGASASGLE